MFGTNGPSLADIAMVTGNRNNNDGAWGEGGWFWGIIILFALFGWGGFGNGFGGNGNNAVSTDYLEAAIQRGFDNQTVVNKLNGLENGICSLGYDQQGQMNGLGMNIMQTGWNLQNAIQQDTIAGMQNTNAIQTQLANCCCENREAIAQVRYDMATNTCALQNTMNQNTRDIIDSQEAGTRAILDYLCQEKISGLQADKAALQAELSQAAQNTVLINALRPAPVPAYNVPNPWGFYGNNWQNGCCCGGNGYYYGG